MVKTTIEKKQALLRKKICPFCSDNTLVLDYKEPRILKKFTSERGKIIPRRISGACAIHQRELAKAIKRARFIALVPFVTKG